MTGAIFHPGKVIAARNSCLRYEPYDLMEKTIRKRRPAECEQAARVGIGGYSSWSWARRAARARERRDLTVPAGTRSMRAISFMA